MHDDFQSDIDPLDELDGATPPLFPRAFIAADGEPRRDAAALVAVLAAGAEPVTVVERADLIAAGSAADGAPGRVTLDAATEALIEGVRCPVAIAPRGLAERDDLELRRIDIGVDGGRGAGAATHVAARLALLHDARLRLIAVAELDGEARPAAPLELERLARHLEHAGEGLPGVWIEKELREGVPDQILVGLAREADLLVLGSRTTYGGAGRVALGDLGERIMRAAPCPVMVVPAP